MKARILLLVLALAALAAGGAPGAENGLATLDFREVVREAKNKVFPAVVFVKCIRESHESGKRISEEMAGSGVIVSPDGEMLTNRHVIDKALEIRCLLFDGRSVHAEVIGSDKDTDLALVRLKLPPDSEPLPAATLGESGSLSEGDFVMAMGAPYGLARSVSIGIISCSRRFLREHSEYSLWLQTDAAINPGNSGGPLVNTRGEVIGINTLVILQGQDLGFAIPADTIARILPHLREHGKADWSWTGLQLQPLRDFNRNIYFEGTEGVIVAETDPESPARRAGIKARDRLLKINGAPVNAFTEEDLPAVRCTVGLLTKYQPAEFELLRDGKPLTAELTPREKGDVEGEELDCPRWDLTVKQINQFDNPGLYFYRKKGVFVYGVKEPGNASTAGLRAQDIILKIDGKDAESLEDVRKIHEEAIANVKTKHKIMFTVLRNGLMNMRVLDFSRDYEKR